MSKLGTIILKRKNKTVYVNKETNSVIKKFNAKLESKSNVLAEALNQAKVEETGLSIPSIKEVFKDGDDWCISSTYIEGKTLQELMDENKDKEDEYIEKLVDIQIDIQKVKCPSLNLLTNKLHERISSTRDYIEATTRYELHMRLNSMPKHTKLCHCDMNPTNTSCNINNCRFWYIQYLRYFLLSIFTTYNHFTNSTNLFFCNF